MWPSTPGRTPKVCYDPLDQLRLSPRACSTASVGFVRGMTTMRFV
jgi:hypothetical protein